MVVPWRCRDVDTTATANFKLRSCWVEVLWVHAVDAAAFDRAPLPLSHCSVADTERLLSAYTGNTGKHSGAETQATTTTPIILTHQDEVVASPSMVGSNPIGRDRSPEIGD